MSLFSKRSGQVRTLLAEAGAALAVTALVAGCGNNYRPVVTPISTSGPAAQPTSYVVAVSTTGTSSAGIATVIDYSGDSILAVAPIGPGPRAFTIDAGGGTGYTLNSDGTLTNFPVSASLLANSVAQSTLPSNAAPVNLLAPSTVLWDANLTGNVTDIFSGSPQTYKLSVPLPSGSTMPIGVFGPITTSAQRYYVLSQNVADTASGAIACNSAPRTAPLGSANPIEVGASSVYTADAAIPVGKCPVYAVESTDQRRFFVLNRGDDTVTVINSQDNTLDNQCPPPTGCVNQSGQTYFTHPVLPLSTTAVTATGVTPPNGTAGMTATAGPIYAEYNAATQQIVVADYDGGTISVIDVSLDVYGNDSPTFGTTYTIAVGNTSTPNPASVTALADGSKAYTANQNDGTTDGTVTVVNLSTHTVEKTLTVEGHPRTVVSTQNSEYSKVYVASPDSPYITIIETTPTVTDIIDTTLLLEGTAVDVRVTTQNGTSNTNIDFSSRVPGYGQPCNLPGSSYTSALTSCQAIP